MNIIDVLCVLPMWIRYIMLLNNVRMNIQLLPVWFLIMMLRVLRICRVLRLARHYTGVKILLLALKASFKVGAACLCTPGAMGRVSGAPLHRRQDFILFPVDSGFPVPIPQIYLLIPPLQNCCPQGCFLMPVQLCKSFV